MEQRKQSYLYRSGEKGSQLCRHEQEACFSREPLGLPSDLQKYPLAICQALGNQLPPYVAQDPELITSFDEPAMFEARLKDNNSLGLITKSLIDGGGFFKEKDDLSFIPLANKTQPQIIMLVNKAQKKRHEQAFEIFYQYLKNLSCTEQDDLCV